MRRGRVATTVALPLQSESLKAGQKKVLQTQSFQGFVGLFTFSDISENRAKSFN